MATSVSKAKFPCNLAVLVFGLTGCLNGLTVIDGYECDKFADDKLYFGRSFSERTAEIRTYPLEKQYAVYVCGVGYIRPPAWDAGQSFSERGAEAIDLLKDKLESSREELELIAIVVLIDSMNNSGQYAASDDQALMKLLEQAKSRMRDPEKRQEFAQRFEHIRGH